MRGAIVALILALSAPSAWAQVPNRNWVKSGTEGAIDICVDLNSIEKHADGLTQYVYLPLCDESFADTMRINLVKCDQDMSGEMIQIQGRPFKHSKDGSYVFGDDSTKSCSLAGQTAKFVCKKPGPHEPCPN